MATKKTVRTKAKGSNARVKGRNPKENSPQKDKLRWVEGIVIILIGVYCYYAFITAQPSLIDQIIGKYILRYLFGNAVPIFCLIAIVSGILMMMNKFREYKATVSYVFLIAVNFMVFLSSYIPNLNTSYKVIDLFGLATYGGYGGIFGTLCAYVLNAILSRTGTIIFLILLTLVELFMIVKINFPNFYSKLHDTDFGFTTFKDKVLDFSDDLKQKRQVRKRERNKSSNAGELIIDEDDMIEYPIDDSLMQREGNEVDVDTQYINIDNELLEQLDKDFPAENSSKKKVDNSSNKSRPEGIKDYMFFMDEEFKQRENSKKNTQKKKIDTAEFESEEQLSFPETNVPVERVKTYQYPSVELLTRANNARSVDDVEIRDNARRISETLNNFKVDATVRNYDIGPSITRFEVKPAPGVKVSKIVNLADDLALALATSDIRIEAPIPGKDAIGIEVPNKKSDIVHLREIIDSDEFMSSAYTLPFSVGKTLSGNNIVGDISDMPHLLIAGSTGSGKSVCINSIIISLLYRQSPEDLKMIMIDPKMVELNQYNSISHLLIPVVTDPEKAAGALSWAIKEMEERYNLFSETGVKDLETYNEYIKREGGEKLPRIVIIIDELADLMMTSPKEVEGAICRIAQKARACGIHLIIATQRPSVDVITGLIKSNIPSRIAFAVASNTDSRTIIDTAGAEKLLGRGDMLYKPVSLSKPLRVQCAYVSDNEIARVIKAVSVDSDPVFDESVNEKIDEHVSNKKKIQKDEKRDELYEDAIEVAFLNQQVSTSMLQRRLGIGYARAGRLIDTLERDGIISGPNGSKPRKLLVAREEIS